MPLEEAAIFRVFHEVTPYLNQVPFLLREANSKTVAAAWLEKYLPTSRVLDREYAGVMSAFRACREGSGVRTELNDDELSRRRLRMTPIERFKPLGLRWGAAFTLWWRLAPQVARDRMAQLQPELARDEGKLMLALKALSDYMKKWGETAEPETWKWYVGCELFGGYLPSKDIADFYEDIHEWVGVPADNRVDRELFRLGVRDALRRGSYDIAPKPLATWAQEYSWARPGSSDGPRLPLVVEGKQKKARKSKNASALVMTPDDVVRFVREKHRQKNKAVQKRELGKVRAVVAGDIKTYLKMSYVDDWLFGGLKGTPWSTLFYSSTQLLSYWRRMSSRIGGPVFLPLDQSKFDHQAMVDMIQIVNQEIVLLISKLPESDAKRDLIEVMHLIEYSLGGGSVTVGNRDVPYLNGVASGWKWTALYDSIINWAELYAARKWVERRLGFDPVSEAVVQGDDSDVVCNSWVSALAVIAAYNEFNITINPAKFFVSAVRDEYLRQVAEVGQISGYVARAIPALFWRNPVSRDPPPGELRAREQLNSWMSVVGRGARYEDVYPIMVKDIAAGNHLKADEVVSWLNTTPALGGGGLGDEIQGLKIVSQIRKPVGVSLGRARGADYLTKKYNLDRRAAEAEFIQRIELPAKTEFETIVEPHFTEVVAKLKPVTRGPSTFARCNPDPTKVPVWIWGLVVEERIRSKDFEGLEKLMLPQAASYSAFLRGRASRAVWYAWARGKVEPAVPVVPGWSQLDSADKARQYGDPWLAGALASAHPTMSKIQTAAIRGCMEARRYVPLEQIRVGG